ncbi:hypothetical protein ACFQDN_22005 [Pseudomonas asuensis]|uniref:Uncharacterized protein n=1 Tax=Pseudomonas asuensis TaxID=1825787 RepID=A0ABQ2H1A8_9PSED|nr:hypothetical protein [Pseudomonas asuensis]GGM25606.1 hypothetical protein GCM10009425_40450 [Pseudomonas asuensis]
MKDKAIASYDGFYIDKHSSSWVLKHPDISEGLMSAKTKHECLQYLARRLLEIDQSILAEAFQQKMREKGDDYGYFDSLDALLDEASSNSKYFIEVLRPELKQRFEESGECSFEIQILR